MAIRCLLTLYITAFPQNYCKGTKFSSFFTHYLYFFCTFASQYLHFAWFHYLGLTGFDGKMRWYVSTRSWAVGGSIISSAGKLIGNNEYALAA